MKILQGMPGVKYTISARARLKSVSRKRAMKWIEQGRLAVERPAEGVVLIDGRIERPEPRRPWHIKRKERVQRYSCMQ